MTGLQPFPMPLFRGEDSASTVFASDSPGRVENGLFTGQGAIEQVGDWLLADTCKDSGPVENDAALGPWPFATQGGASAASAGVAISFDDSANKLWLHQLGEDRTILRTLDTGLSYTEAAPPQVTAFEFFGLFLFMPYGREAAASRRGLCIFDPTTTGTITNPSVSIVAGGTGAAKIRGRGIACHQGGTVLTWGYQSEETGQVDVPHMLRGSKYGATDLTADASWQASAADDQSGWGVAVGTLGLPIVACATSGAYTIIGKASEVFRLGGAWKTQLFYDPIGQHGPLSTTGMASNGVLAAWMSEKGPAISVNGGAVQLIGTDQLRRRLLTYMDLNNCWAVHHKTGTRIGWLLRRQRTITGDPVTHFWPDEILWWDYERDEFSVQGVPTTCISIGTTDGPSLTLAAPAGAPSSLVATPTQTTCALTWSHSGGDPSAKTVVQYRVLGTSTYTTAGVTGFGATSYTISGLNDGTTYEWRLRYFKNGQYGALVSGTNFTTLDAGAVSAPTSLAGEITSYYTSGAKTYSVATITWVQATTAAGAWTDVFEASSNSFAAASLLGSVHVTSPSITRENLLTTPRTVRYYWVRDRLADGTLGSEVGSITVTYDYP